MNDSPEVARLKHTIFEAKGCPEVQHRLLKQLRLVRAKEALNALRNAYPKGFYIHERPR